VCVIYGYSVDYRQDLTQNQSFSFRFLVLSGLRRRSIYEQRRTKTGEIHVYRFTYGRHAVNTESTFRERNLIPRAQQIRRREHAFVVIAGVTTISVCYYVLIDIAANQNVQKNKRYIKKKMNNSILDVSSETRDKREYVYTHIYINVIVSK